MTTMTTTIMAMMGAHASAGDDQVYPTSYFERLQKVRVLVMMLGILTGACVQWGVPAWRCRHPLVLQYVGDVLAALYPWLEHGACRQVRRTDGRLRNVHVSCAEQWRADHCHHGGRARSASGAPLCRCAMGPTGIARGARLLVVAACACGFPANDHETGERCCIAATPPFRVALQVVACCVSPAHVRLAQMLVHDPCGHAGGERCLCSHAAAARSARAVASGCSGRIARPDPCDSHQGLWRLFTDNQTDRQACDDDNDTSSGRQYPNAHHPCMMHRQWTWVWCACNSAANSPNHSALVIRRLSGRTISCIWQAHQRQTHSSGKARLPVRDPPATTPLCEWPISIAGPPRCTLALFPSPFLRYDAPRMPSAS
jgi:hypothetical protein